ncbi:hypothetical protein CBR_g19106 [Chara braunii]|uniref:Mitochondrial carrier protein n=1 Tax=Chara braunii TaxID=69332 RepID=A0A388KXD3_CHABU|nr:hypothetical protein CBR_g19106 [Chara braunii]|eukprot:GBG74701.1 hypothetical protein CBR_g19106 [Chara braunii]
MEWLKRFSRLLAEGRSANSTDKRNLTVRINVLDSSRLQARRESPMVVPTSISLPEKQQGYPQQDTSWVSSNRCGYGGGHGFRFRRLFAAAASSSSRTARQILNDDSKDAQSFQLGTIAGDLELSMVMESLSLETDGRYHAGGGGGDVVIGFQPTDHLRHRVHEGLGDGEDLVGRVGQGLARTRRRKWTSRRAPFAATSLNLLHGRGKGKVEGREAGMETDRANGREPNDRVCPLQEGGGGEENGGVKGDGQNALSGKSCSFAAAAVLSLLQGSGSGSVLCRSSAKGDMGERETVAGEPTRTTKESRQARGHLLEEEKKKDKVNGNQDHCRMTRVRQAGNKPAMAEDLLEYASLGVRRIAKGKQGGEQVLEKKWKLINHSQRASQAVSREEEGDSHVDEDKPAKTKAQEKPGMLLNSPTHTSEMSENRSQMSEKTQKHSEMSENGCDKGKLGEEMCLDMRLQRLKTTGERLASAISNVQVSDNGLKTEMPEEKNSDVGTKELVAEVSRGLSEIGKDLRIPVTSTYIPPVGPVRALELKQLLCGALAGGAAATAVGPLTALVTRMVARSAPPQSTPQVLGSVLKMQGFQLLTFLRNVLIVSTARGIDFVTYETVRRRILGVPRGKEPRVLPFSRGISLATLPGAAAGVMATLTVYPAVNLVDRINAEPSRYKGLPDALIKVLRNEGVSHLYTGLAPTLLVLVPSAIVNYYTYNTLKNLYIRRHLEVDRINSWNTIWMGAVAGAVARFMTFPLVVTRMDMTFSLATDPVFNWAPSPQGFTNTWSALHTIIQNDGIMGLYRGVVPSVVSVAPRSAVEWAVYEAAKRVFIAVGEEDRNQFKDASETA